MTNVSELQGRPFYILDDIKDIYLDENFLETLYKEYEEWLFYPDDFNINGKFLEFIELVIDSGLCNIVEKVNGDSYSSPYSSYIKIDDVDAHKQFLSLAVKNNLIPRNKDDRLRNVCFKFLSARLIGECSRCNYGYVIEGSLADKLGITISLVHKFNLSDFIDRYTGSPL